MVETAATAKEWGQRLVTPQRISVEQSMRFRFFYALVTLIVMGLAAFDALGKDQPKRKAAVEERAAKEKAAEADAAEAEAVAAPVIRVLQAAPVAVDEQALNPALVQHFEQQYRSMLKSELEFVREVCNLPVGDRPRVRAAGEKILKETARKMAQQQQRNQQPQVARMARTAAVNPRAQIREGIATALRGVLTAEQMRQYEEESASRQEARKQAATLDVVSRIDAVLYLSASQREAITESITSKWEERWEQWLMIHVYGNQYLPNVPDTVVSKHLTPEQTAVWSTLQKIEVGFFDQAHGLVFVDDDWWGEEPSEADQPNAAVGVGEEFTSEK
jgi:hypothetical protein